MGDAPQTAADAPPDAVLVSYRASIDNIDAALIHILAERFRITKAVGAYKAEHRLPPPTRRARIARSPGCANWPTRRSWTPILAKNSCGSSSTR